MTQENCKIFCKQPVGVLNQKQKEMLLQIFKIQQVSGFAIRQNFKDLSKRKFYYPVNKMIGMGYIENDSPGIYNLKVTAKGKQYLEGLFGQLQNNTLYLNGIMDRANGLTINQPIIQRPDTIPNGFTVSEKSKDLHWSVPQLNYTDKQVSIRITTKTISYYFKECYSPDPFHAVNVCLNQVFKFSKSLEEQGFKLSLPNTTIPAQEHALFNKELAKFTQKYQIHYKSEHLTFDHSITQNEFELISPEYSAEEFLRVTDFLEAIARGQITIQTILDLQKQLQNTGGCQ